MATWWQRIFFKFRYVWVSVDKGAYWDADSKVWRDPYTHEPLPADEALRRRGIINFYNRVGRLSRVYNLPWDEALEKYRRGLRELAEAPPDEQEKIREELFPSE